MGFLVNLGIGKFQICPAKTMKQLGFIMSSETQMLSLSLTKVKKTEAALSTLRQLAQVEQEIPALLVASVVGTLWSVHAVAHRATAIEARAMICTLQKILSTQEIRMCHDPGQLRFILKRVWKGNVIWTLAAERELRFWLRVDFRASAAPLFFDAVNAHIVRSRRRIYFSIL